MIFLYVQVYFYLVQCVTCDGLASRPGGVEILLAASCYGNRDKLRQYEPVWLIRLHLSTLQKDCYALLPEM